MNPRNLRIVVVVIAVAVLLVSSALYVVDETEQVVITQLGKPVGQAITQAGLHFKLPFIQKATYFEKRIMKWDGRPNQIPTKDKKYIWVDTTARWRIKDPLQFLKSVGSLTTANSRLDGIIDSVVRNHVSNNYLVELVRSEGWEEAKQKLQEAGIEELQFPEGGSEGMASEDAVGPLSKGREKITREMLADGAALFPGYGMELLDIRIKRINYVESVQQKVFDRMISERKRIAAQYRSEGEGEKAVIMGRMERELAKINSEAHRESQQVRGKADAEATRIYAEAFNKNPEFFSFYRTLDFYQNFSNPKGVLVLSTDAEVFKYLGSSKGTGGQVK